MINELKTVYKTIKENWVLEFLTKHGTISCYETRIDGKIADQYFRIHPSLHSDNLLSDMQFRYYGTDFNYQTFKLDYLNNKIPHAHEYLKHKVQFLNQEDLIIFDDFERLYCLLALDMQTYNIIEKKPLITAQSIKVYPSYDLDAVEKHLTKSIGENGIISCTTSYDYDVMDDIKYPYVEFIIIPPEDIIQKYEIHDFDNALIEYAGLNQFIKGR